MNATSGGRSSFSHFDAWLWTVGLTSSLIGGLMLAQLIGGRPPGLAFGAALEVVLYVAATVYVATAGAAEQYRKPGALFERLGLTRAPLWLLGSALLLGVLLHSLTDVVQMLVESVAPTPEAVSKERLQRLSAGGFFERVSLAIFVCVLAPLAEELFFRGALYARLSPGRAPLRVGLTLAACFTVSHAEPRIWAPLLVVGLALGLVRAASPSLAPCFLLHAAFNARTLILVWTEPNPAEPPTTAWPLVFVSSALALALLGRIAVAARDLVNAR